MTGIITAHAQIIAQFIITITIIITTHYCFIAQHDARNRNHRQRQIGLVIILPNLRYLHHYFTSGSDPTDDRQQYDTTTD